MTDRFQEPAGINIVTTIITNYKSLFQWKNKQTSQTIGKITGFFVLIVMHFPFIINSGVERHHHHKLCSAVEVVETSYNCNQSFWLERQLWHKSEDRSFPFYWFRNRIWCFCVKTFYFGNFSAKTLIRFLHVLSFCWS